MEGTGAVESSYTYVQSYLVVGIDSRKMCASSSEVFLGFPPNTNSGLSACSVDLPPNYNVQYLLLTVVFNLCMLLTVVFNLPTIVL